MNFLCSFHGLVSIFSLRAEISGNAKFCIFPFSNARKVINLNDLLFFFYNWDSPHARLNSHYEAWSYKKKSTKKITGYRKSV